uniref:Uncharacterized protein n=1 Tax=Tetraselmis sp. GSL018 TaxID=582737 RepID=A0A061RAU4_9CHLO|mmetsp:Transcript_41240/g.97858  ORF Transcript_41240/g.97858 Transcript_41240/m.97858 type:complete len:349 (+) Transcript_41240:245-1291(+)|eukprot:CAMPEP_0177595212 /NCGR_PEP_ID=MMETSP0419_2-20121207/10227_1 /TAXON_ID=582737 /ORGANISM="Tetraselmis sp., Strain GSL018" /LENGTH=348 /DNA_ID=CAMNT_0019086639 /DNA_START=198 /DNA_END=1244 /DNA_ORIENTATION=+
MSECIVYNDDILVDLTGSSVFYGSPEEVVDDAKTAVPKLQSAVEKLQRGFGSDKDLALIAKLSPVRSDSVTGTSWEWTWNNSKLYWNNKDLVDEHVSALALLLRPRCLPNGSLAYAEKLRVLELNGNRICDAGASALAEVISPQRLPSGRLAPGLALEELALSGNKIGAAGAAALARALSPCADPVSGAVLVNRSLRTLTLSGNPIGPTGARSLAEGPLRAAEPVPGAEDEAGASSALETLHIGGCGVGDEGARFLAQALCSAGAGASLRSLFLGDNGIGDRGALSIASALQELAASQRTSGRMSLQKLNLWGNPISSAARETLLDARDHVNACRQSGEPMAIAVDDK